MMTSEVKCGTRYPITNMFDGRPDTAWVYNKYWRHLAPGESPEDDNPEQRFDHGVGTTITIDTSDFPRCTSFVADGLGIINGYAKSDAVYRRNNRITKIHIDCEGEGRGDTNWAGTFTLQEVQQLQRINFPHQRWLSIDIRVDAVSIGPDDDLCISELVLYNHGKPMPWRMTSCVLCNDSDDCGCGGGPTYKLFRHSQGSLAHVNSTFDAIAGIAPQPASDHVVWYAHDTLFLYDMRHDAILLQWKAPAITFLGWVNAHRAYIFTEAKKSTHWYLLNGDNYTLQPCRPPDENTEFQTFAKLGEDEGN